MLEFNILGCILEYAQAQKLGALAPNQVLKTHLLESNNMLL
jgi:hypothetical protein